MIVAIADDITGAAEIAAIGWRQGLSAQVQMTHVARADADLVVMDTDTRNSTDDDARRIVGDLAGRLQAMPFQWYFKKVDSVLRGNVGAEIEALMQALGQARTILAPANPSRGRVIANGRYFIDDVPLDQTDFAHDPEHPARSSSIADSLLVSDRCEVHVLDPAAYLGEETGIVVAQARSLAELAQWSELPDKDTLAAGGADFFQALLERRVPAGQDRPRVPLRPVNGPKLFVCGSKRRVGSQPTRQCAAESTRGLRTRPAPCLMPERAADLPGQWASDIVTALAASGRAIVAVGQAAERNSLSALDVRRQMAATVQRVIEQIAIGELFIEGGATASAILRGLGWDRLDVVGEYGPGVVRLAVTGVPEQIVTLKPGSYPWPDGIWTLM